MIAGATRGTGGNALSRHLLKRQDGQTVHVLPARGLSAEDLPGQIRELVASAAHGRTSRPVHHVHIDPPPDVSDPDSIIKTFVAAYEREFGLENSPTCAVRHIEDGREHEHRVWSLVRGDGSIVSLAHDHARREKVSRITEFECGLPMTQGKHNRSVAAALRKEGRADIADAMEAVGLLDGRRPVAHSTPRQRAQAERTAVPLDEIRIQALAAWRASNNSKEFAVALHSFDFSVAQGDRGYLLIDRSGSVHSLNRVLAAAARQAGEDKITAVAVKQRLGGIRCPTVKESRNGRNADNARRKSRRSDLSGGPLRPGNRTGIVAASPTPTNRPERGAVASRRVEGVVDGNRSDFGEAWRNPRSPRHRVVERAAIAGIGSNDFRALRCAANTVLSGDNARTSRRRVVERGAVASFEAMDITSLRSLAAKLAAGGTLDDSEWSSLQEDRMKALRPAKALDYKTRLLAEIVPEGFDVMPFSSDIHMIQKASPENPVARIMTRDGGWIEIDTVSGKVIRTWGSKGRAQVLAAALADELGVEVEHLARTAGFGADTEALKVARLSEDRIKELAAWWTSRGYIAIAASDGCWVSIGRTRIRDLGQRMEVYGPISDDVAEAIVLKAKESWNGGLYLDGGGWTQADQDKIWLECQRKGVEVENCHPSQAARTAGHREQEASASKAKTISTARSAISAATNLRDAAGGDLEALQRLTRSLQAFIVSHLDDDQRKHLAAQAVSDVVPELQRFRTLGADELAEFERRGEWFSPPRPRRRDHDRDHENRLDM